MLISHFETLSVASFSNVKTAQHFKEIFLVKFKRKVIESKLSQEPVCILIHADGGAKCLTKFCHNFFPVAEQKSHSRVWLILSTFLRLRSTFCKLFVLVCLLKIVVYSFFYFNEILKIISIFQNVSIYFKGKVVVLAV